MNMTNLEDLEYNKFALSDWDIVMKTAEWVWPFSAVSFEDRNDLEAGKFKNWEVRVKITF